MSPNHFTNKRIIGLVMDTLEINNFTTFPGVGCGAYESVIIRFKASPVQHNLPTGTELGNIRLKIHKSDRSIPYKLQICYLHSVMKDVVISIL